MNDKVTGQVSHSAAEVYEEFFVPALFQQWVAHVADAAQLSPGDKAIDVACGTGVLARELATRVSPGGTVTGVDRNNGMIAVAAMRAPEVEWRIAQAESLPFDDTSFDAVVSQFGLMFFDDRAKAIAEMWRVLKPGGRLAVAVWDKLENIRGYGILANLLERLHGDRVAEEVRVPFGMGDARKLAELFRSAGVGEPKVHTINLNATFPSVEAWLNLEVHGWTLGEMLDEKEVSALIGEAEIALKEYVLEDGRCSYPAAAHVVTGSKPG